MDFSLKVYIEKKDSFKMEEYVVPQKLPYTANFSHLNHIHTYNINYSTISSVILWGKCSKGISIVNF